MVGEDVDAGVVSRAKIERRREKKLVSLGLNTKGPVENDRRALARPGAGAERLVNTTVVTEAIFEELGTELGLPIGTGQSGITLGGNESMPIVEGNMANLCFVDKFAGKK